MTPLLLLAAAVFAWLAVDAWRHSSPRHEAPHEIGAKERGESLGGVPVAEQLRRQAWQRRHGVGAPGQVVWVWSILAGGCLVAAASGVRVKRTNSATGTDAQRQCVANRARERTSPGARQLRARRIWP